MRTMGIDEAGRGCVLGSLLVGAFVVETECDDALRQAGARDSKTLSAKRRLAARESLTALGQPDIREITAREIDQNNLNALEEAAIIDLVLTWRPDHVFMDALGHPRTLPALEERLSRALKPTLPHLTWTIEPKADGTYPVVGAASIFAKTTRDQLLDELRSEFGILGSGYPSDPKTRAWLLEWARREEPWPHFVRTRWQTVADIAQKAMF